MEDFEEADIEVSCTKTEMCDIKNLVSVNQLN